jgi:uncharacterized repeat protein (TIGR02543 family)
MKRILTLILAVVMIMAILPTTPIYAATPKLSDEYYRNLESNKTRIENERTDVYALNFYSFSPSKDWSKIYPEQYAAMKEITKGIDNDYAKAKAIADWVNKNMTYDTRNDADGSLAAAGVPKWLRGDCDEYAEAAELLFKLAGLPAKKITGDAKTVGWVGHAWNHVFVDNRWVFVDTTKGFGIFDMSVEDWTGDHRIGRLPNTTWDGTLSIIDTSSRDTVLTLGPLPIYTTITDIPELATVKLFTDLECTKPVDPKTWKFDAHNRELYTKTHRVSFEIQLDNANKSLVSHIVREENGTQYSFITVPDGAKLPQVKLPVKSGYTFIGWRELFNDKAPIWNEDTDKVTDDISFVAVFKKGTVNYTVKYNTNGGTAVKDTTIKANTSIKKPADPKRTGYKFTGWYKDSALKEAWNFSTDLVRRNTTLYAGWESTNNAKPTASKVLVNGKAVEFDAYTINNNNYFKLRDLAQAVNNTEKNFEVTWDGKKNAINLISNKAYTPAGGELSKGDGKAKAATLSTSKIFKDGKEISLTAYTINGNNYFKLRDIAKAFDIGVTWDSKTNTIGIDTAISYVEE